MSCIGTSRGLPPTSLTLVQRVHPDEGIVIKDNEIFITYTAGNQKYTASGFMRNQPVLKDGVPTGETWHNIELHQYPQGRFDETIRETMKQYEARYGVKPRVFLGKIPK